MDSSVSLKDRIWFLRVCHRVSNVLYLFVSLASSQNDECFIQKFLDVMRCFLKAQKDPTLVVMVDCIADYYVLNGGMLSHKLVI